VRVTRRNDDRARRLSAAVLDGDSDGDRGSASGCEKLACSSAHVSQRKHTIGAGSDDNASKRGGSSQLLEAEHVDGVDDGSENEVECV
jgi:hypothetical protein